LIKNSNERPTIREIFMEPLIQKTIEEFIRSDGQYTTMLKIPIKKTGLHKEMQKQQGQESAANNMKPQKSNSEQYGLDATVVSVSTQNLSVQKSKSHNPQPQIPENETPQQRMMRRKEEQRRLEEERLKNAAREAHLVKKEIKNKKINELQSHVSFGTSQSTSTISISSKPTNQNNPYGQQIQSNQFQQQSQNYGGYQGSSPVKNQSRVENNPFPGQQFNNYSQISDLTAFSTMKDREVQVI